MVVNGGKSGDSYSLADTSHSNVMLETIKQAEDGDGWIVRMYETDNALTRASLFWNRPIASVEECSCIEEEKCSGVFVPMTEGGYEIPFTIKPYEIKTFRIREK